MDIDSIRAHATNPGCGLFKFHAIEIGRRCAACTPLDVCVSRSCNGGGEAVWTSVRFESEIAVEWRGNEWMNGLFENDSNRVFFEGRIFVRVDVKGQFYFFFFFFRSSKEFVW